MMGHSEHGIEVLSGLSRLILALVSTGADWQSDFHHMILLTNPCF